MILVYLQVPKEYQSPLCSPPFKYHQADMGHPSKGFKVQDLSVCYCIRSFFPFFSLFCSVHPFQNVKTMPLIVTNCVNIFLKIFHS